MASPVWWAVPTVADLRCCCRRAERSSPSGSRTRPPPTTTLRQLPFRYAKTKPTPSLPNGEISKLVTVVYADASGWARVMHRVPPRRCGRASSTQTRISPRRVPTTSWSPSRFTKASPGAHVVPSHWGRALLQREGKLVLAHPLSGVGTTCKSRSLRSSTGCRGPGNSRPTSPPATSKAGVSTPRSWYQCPP